MKKILVIDDEADLREMVQLALRHKGFAVTLAENGAKGILAARKELPDLILCDVKMEQMDGYSTLSALRSEPATDSIPFILMTGVADHEGMRHGMELGADDYLPKPFSLDALFGAVEARLKKAEAMRQAAQKHLEDLRANISLMLPHEMRTPLNGILAYGEMLSARAVSLPPEEVAEMGQVIYDSGKRLERLIENFLIYAQIEMLSADAQRLDRLGAETTSHPAKLVSEHAQAQADLAGRTPDLQLDLADSPVGISAAYLAKIVDELVQNAFKFSLPGTAVSIRLFPAPKGLALAITDHGRGFSAEQVSRIGAYMQFDRKLHEQQGLGLGLVIAKRLVELHDGTLTISSEPGSATTVTVEFPQR